MDQYSKKAMELLAVVLGIFIPIDLQVAFWGVVMTPKTRWWLDQGRIRIGKEEVNYFHQTTAGSGTDEFKQVQEINQRKLDEVLQAFRSEEVYRADTGEKVEGFWFERGFYNNPEGDYRRRKLAFNVFHGLQTRIGGQLQRRWKMTMVSIPGSDYRFKALIIESDVPPRKDGNP